MNIELFNKDYNFGILNENNLSNIFQNKFDKNLKKTVNRYDAFDFESDNTLLELKTRNNFKNTYRDTMISFSKILKARLTTKDVYFCF